LTNDAYVNSQFMSQLPYQQQQQILMQQNQQPFYAPNHLQPQGLVAGAHQNQINLSLNHHRSKSPPSLQSPPMSPISRMPLSPKSPRQRSAVGLSTNYVNSNNLSLPQQHQHQLVQQNQKHVLSVSCVLCFIYSFLVVSSSLY
jgi:hypothetical protein